MKQVKLFEAKTLKELEKQINRFCYKLDAKNHTIINIHIDIRTSTAWVLYGT